MYKYAVHHIQLSGNLIRPANLCSLFCDLTVCAIKYMFAHSHAF